MMTKSPIDFDISVSADKVKRSQKRGSASRPVRRRNPGPCDHPDCENEGRYRAPSIPGQTDGIRWLCHAHIEEYNRKWNWFKNRQDSAASETANEVDTSYQGGGVHRLRVHGWSRASVRSARLSSVEMRALRVLNLGQDSTMVEIRREYRSLVKDLHPDNNQGDRSDEGRLKEVVQAWNILRNSRNIIDRTGR